MTNSIQPKVSVVTVVRNDPLGFLITARSILSQDYDNLEWIVVDGASTDMTGNYVKQLSPAMACYLIEPDNGVYDAMNKGIDLATGEWLFFMNADDAFYAPNTLSTYSENLTEADDIIYADAMRREDSVIHAYHSPENHWRGNVFDHQTACIRASLCKKLRFDDSLQICADLDLFSRARAEDASFRKLENVIAVIKPYHNGISADYLDRQQERVQVLRKYYEGPELLAYLRSEFKATTERMDLSEQLVHDLMELIGDHK